MATGTINMQDEFLANIGRVQFVSGQMSCVIFIPSAYRGVMFVCSSESTLQGLYHVYALNGGRAYATPFYSASSITVTNGATNQITLTSAIADGINVCFLSLVASEKPYYLSGNVV